MRLLRASAILSVSIDALVRADAYGRRAESTPIARQRGHRRRPVLLTAQQTLARVNEENLRHTFGLNDDSPIGTGVVVAVIDSGIAPLADFRGRIAAFIDCTYD